VPLCESILKAVFDRGVDVRLRAGSSASEDRDGAVLHGRSRRWWCVLAGSLLAGVVLSVGCSAPLPEPVADGCRSSQQCPQGTACVSNRCVPVANDIGDFEISPPIDAADASAPDGTCGCTADNECQFAGPCVTAVCEQGCCVAKALPAGTTCTDNDICPAPGSCSLGLCTATGPPCDDGEGCTVDSCTPNGCTHVPFANGEVCVGDNLPCTADTCQQGHCVSGLKADACLIDGACRAPGDIDAEHPCNVCEPATFQEGWTARTSGPCDDSDACTTETACTDTSVCVGKEVVCDDDNACTDDACDSAAGCVHLSNEGTCTVEDPCSIGGTCKDGKCMSAGMAKCNDGNPCTADSCVEGFGCIHKPQDGACLADTDPCTDDACQLGKCVAVPSASVCKIGGTCVSAGSSAANNPCKICSPQLDSKNWTVLDGPLCDDGNPCTSFDGCDNGACDGLPTNCDDKQPCTADTCDPGKGCVNTPVSKVCDDGSKCTTKDNCLAGVCVGTQIPLADCDDSNPCTIDQCVAAYGCSNKPAALPCDDGDKCTKGDICVAGKCTAGQIVCPCEFDSDCVDKNPCTTDECVLGAGCKNEALPKDSSCDDGDKCTVGDLCTGLACVGKQQVCDDGNPCTKDGCVAEVGCTHLPLNAVTCDDKDKCTAGDLCQTGKCTGTPKNCDDGNACSVDGCDPTSSLCTHVAAADGSVCPDDNVPCTVDVCLKAVCSHSTVADSFCLISGACLSGGALHPAQQCWGCKPLVNPTGWTILAGSGCKDGNSCTVGETCTKTGKCTGKPADCDDDNGCTADACNPQAPGGDGCIHSPLAGVCNDADLCTKDDKCTAGACGGKAVDCSDGNACTVNGCSADKGCYATKLQNGTLCPADALACTSDECIDGYCRHNVKAGFCAIGSACKKDGDKDGKNPCLGCDASKSQALWSALTGGKCDDGNTCTGADTCAAGTCQGDATKACDDNNPCTADTCDKQKGCAHAPTTGTCEDGDLCTSDDACKAGKCVAGNVVQCKSTADSGKCEVTVCLPTKGCVNETRCGPLHTCSKGLCLSGDGNKLGPMKVSPPTGVAGQPMRPTIRWQESGSGPFGAVPRLWLAAQTNACSPALSTWSGVFSALFEPAAKAPAFRQLKTPSPTGTASWCAIHPVLSAHPTTFDAVVMGWVEGGANGSACALSSRGGLLRVGLAGLHGADVAMSVGSKCPSGGGPQPEAARPAMILLGAGPISNKQDPAQLSGLVARASGAGPLTYAGNVVGAWGAASGVVLPPSALAGHTEFKTASRPVVSAWTSGSALFSVSRYKNSAGGYVPAVTAVRVDGKGKLAPKRNVVLTGVALAGATPAYHAVEATYDPDIKRVGVLVSGTLATANSIRGFLAFARIHPDQATLGSPQVAVVHDVPKAIGGQATISAFRVAQIPGSPHFLAAWAAPNTAIIKAFRIQPKDDSSFTAVDLGALAGTFSGQTVGTTVVSSGGLSELLVDPDGQRFSLAWEGVGSLYLLTAPISK